ncbi:MAG: AmmeMemoRadiSam system protein A [Clostridia bacterium]|nr:AmmeMemoRadiSam system protein A [Clostridia bacterium]
MAVKAVVLLNENYGVCVGFLLPHPPIAVPEVGRGRENDAAATLRSYRTAADEIERLRPDTVVLLSPHAPMFSDYVFIYDAPMLEGGLEQFGARGLKLRFEQDTPLRDELLRLMAEEGIPGGGLSCGEMHRHGISGALDHGCVVPLYYLGAGYASFNLVAMSCSGLDMQRLYRLGKLIAQAAANAGRRVCVAASGDMSHKVNEQSPYGFCPEGAQFDALVAGALQEADLPALLAIDPSVREKAAECGYRSLVILCGAFDGIKPQVTLLSNEAPFGIGYCAAVFTSGPGGAPDAFEAARRLATAGRHESPQVKIARETLETYVRTHKAPEPGHFKALYGDEKGLFDRQAGVFVSLKISGALRGCIGTTAPTTGCVAQEITRNAVCAGAQDPRFDPVEADELAFLDYSVDVLSQSEPVRSRDELDPEKFGVIVRHGGRSGLLLPDLEGVETVDRQLEIACRKAGIDPKGDFEIRRFTVTRYR